MMFRLRGIRYLVLFIALALMSATSGAAALLGPEITAQGFDMTEEQEGPLGEFGRIRVRFEVPDRVEELYVKERSYDVDLARTPEMAHFSLFGLKTQVMQLTDVTLDFQNYINQKVEVEGSYAFDLRVTDRKGRSASARLLVRVVAPSSVEQQSGEEPLETASFRFVRVGASAVSGADTFGVTWRTVESNDVVIELTKQAHGASKLIQLTPSDYDETKTRKQLGKKIRESDGTSALRFATVAGKASGSVFGVISQEVPYLLRVTGSHTSISRRGTTVTLGGEYMR